MPYSDKLTESYEELGTRLTGSAELSEALAVLEHTLEEVGGAVKKAIEERDSSIETLIKELHEIRSELHDLKI